MNTHQVITTRRTVRRFKQDPIPNDALERMLEAARLAPSGGNQQPLEFIVVTDPGVRGKVFPLLAWAAHIRPRRNPQPGQEPTAYVMVLVNRTIVPSGGDADVAGAIVNLCLAAWSDGIGSCWLGGIQRQARDVLAIPEDRTINGVVALGYPDESPVVAPWAGSHPYWLDDNDVLHVPKRDPNDIIHRETFGG